LNGERVDPGGGRVVLCPTVCVSFDGQRDYGVASIGLGAAEMPPGLAVLGSGDVLGGIALIGAGSAVVCGVVVLHRFGASRRMWSWVAALAQEPEMPERSEGSVAEDDSSDRPQY
jgi:hypothetical protein